MATTGRPALAERAVLPVLMLFVVAATAGLALQARRTEAAHRETAERALQDYAAFAAWQYVSAARQSARHLAHSSLQPLHDIPATGGALPRPAATLFAARDSAPCDCMLARTAHVAFRIELGSGQEAGTQLLETRDGSVVAADAITARTRATLVSLASRTPVPVFDDARPRSELLVLDTLDGRPTAIAYSAVRGPDGRPRAIYGLLADAAPVTETFDRIAKRARLLPPALVGAVPNDSLLRVRVTAPGGWALVGSTESVAGAFAASDTVGGSAEGLQASVAILPAAARTLVIGGLPGSRFPVYMALFALTVALTVAAFIQVRRWQQLARLRGLFVANVSHELRTPLTQISMFSEILLSGQDRPREEARQFLSIIHREARRLTTLIESVLRFSHTQSRGRAFRPELVLVAEEVHEALRAFAPIASAAEATISVEHTHEQLEAIVDPGAFRQVVLNLLDNAVKYGPRGQRITLHLGRDADALRLAVSDQGPGIPAHSRAQALQPFVRLVATEGRRTTGTGIGLSVVRDVAAAHGGTVQIEDAPGGGACVTVTFAQPAMPGAVAAGVR